MQIHDTELLRESMKQSISGAHLQTRRERESERGSYTTSAAVIRMPTQSEFGIIQHGKRLVVAVDHNGTHLPRYAYVALTGT